MYLQSILLIISAYLLGSVSPTYLIGRWFGGKDLRDYGSGSLGGSMVWEHVGRWAVVPVILFDIFKAAVPVWLGLWLGLSMTVSAAAGLAAAIGPNWSIFFRFRGGRGMGTFGGVWLAIFPWGLAWMTLWLGIGWRLGDSAPFLLLSLLTIPILSYFLGGPEIVGQLSGAMILIALAKRLEANHRPLPPPGPERLKVLLRRALLDRDVASHEEWLQQEPQEENSSGLPDH
jgi:glycerol-3-phosphate acyltransferase PlsY